MLQKFSLKSLFFFTLKSLYKGTEKNTWELYGTKWRNRVQNCLSHHSHLVSFLDACDLSSLYSPFGYKITVLKISNLKSQLFRGRENFLKKQKKEEENMWQFGYFVSPVSSEEHNVTMYYQRLLAISLNLDLWVLKNNQNTMKQILKLLFK